MVQEVCYKNIFNTVREAILILDENIRVLSANRSFFNIFKVDSANTIGSFLFDLGNGQWNIQELRVLLETIIPKKTSVDNFEIEHNFEGIGQRIMLLNACKIAEKNDSRQRILLVIEDITERRKADLEREKLINELKDSLAKVQQLSGLLPICASCKKIKDDKGCWSPLETYISKHSEVLFSHGVCPECSEKIIKGFD